MTEGPSPPSSSTHTVPRCVAFRRVCDKHVAALAHPPGGQAQGVYAMPGAMPFPQDIHAVPLP